MRTYLESYSKEELMDIVELMAKNIDVMDGVWFQAVEKRHGMDEAVESDVEAWTRFGPAEGRRIKKFLQLDEHPGLEGLQKALALKYDSIANTYDFRWDNDGSLVFRIVDCRVQTARKRKGLEYHPCKPVAKVEYTGFAGAIDDRIVCECISCYPDITDETCGCSWRFSLPE